MCGIAGIIRNDARDEISPSVLQAMAHAIHRSEEHTSELQSQSNLVCRLLLEKKKQLAHTSGPRVKTYSIGFDEPAYDKLEHARRVATHFDTAPHDLDVTPAAINMPDRLDSDF